MMLSNSTPYDETPYPSGPYQQTHPDRLETLAKFFGMSPPDIRRCRVLELGAADGSNLIPMACALPHSSFVGIDLSQTHVDAGLTTIASLGLTNVELLRLDILDIDASFGLFDYVIVHGVYSWVPSGVQERILEICRQYLNADGVAYVSYNTNPGWRMRGLLRDMMLYHARRFDDPKTRIDQSRALVKWLAETVESQDDPYAMLLKRELDQMGTWPDSYFRHDSLGEINEPLYFHEFVARAEGHGLQYLAEAEFTPMLASNYAPAVDEALNRMGRDIVELEQYMDFLRNRHFRQTLLCHRGVKLNRALGPWSLEGFHVSASLQVVNAELDLRADQTVSFLGSRGLTISASEPIVKAGLLCLGRCWPQSMPFVDLLVAARNVLAIEAVAPALASVDTDRQVLGSALLTIYTKGLCELHVHAVRFAREAGERPCACPLVRLQAKQGEPVTNRRHERVYLDSLAVHLLPLLDGKLGRDALIDGLARAVSDGALVLELGERRTAGIEEIRAVLASELDQKLAQFAQQALLVG